jgi:hypothetical protein
MYKCAEALYVEAEIGVAKKPRWSRKKQQLACLRDEKDRIV